MLGLVVQVEPVLVGAVFDAGAVDRLDQMLLGLLHARHVALELHFGLFDCVVHLEIRGILDHLGSEQALHEHASILPAESQVDVADLFGTKLLKETVAGTVRQHAVQIGDRLEERLPRHIVLLFDQIRRDLQWYPVVQIAHTSQSERVVD